VFKSILIAIACIVSYTNVQGQNNQQKWALLAAYEANYTGQNSILHALYSKQKHQLEAGINYNFSDGFAANPVIGLGFGYGYTILQDSHWTLRSGVGYRRQKPLTIVNIQILTYTQTMEYRLSKRLSAASKLSYGVAAERAASAGSFVQQNNITGSFTLGCVIHL
jgi:hypothetical protein